MVVVVRFVIPDIFGSDGRDGDASCRGRQYNCSGAPLTLRDRRHLLDDNTIVDLSIKKR